MTMTALPFRASKRFILDGQQVVPGDVVDVSMLDAQRVRNMERGNYGMRVSADVDHVPTKRAKPVRRRDRPPVAEPVHSEVEQVDLGEEVSL